jgi:hypothetical protein
MAVVRINVDPHQTPKEEAELVARVASAIAEETGDELVEFELTKSDSVHISHGVGERMSRGARWSG